jgi:hypothetical protein
MNAQGLKFVLTSPTVEARSMFLYELAPGATKEDSFDLLNQFDDPLEVRVYSMDAELIEDDTDSKIDSYWDEPDAVGSWVQFHEVDRGESFILEPNMEKRISFTVSVPEGSAFEDHYGAITVVYNTTDPLALENSVGIEYQLGKMIKVRVAEQSKDLELYDLKGEIDATRWGYRYRFFAVFLVVNAFFIALFWILLKKGKK